MTQATPESHLLSINEMNDMTGKVVIVTGPTSGIGKEIAAGLARCGARVVLACRNTARGDEIAADIVKKTGSTCEVMLYDASKISSVREFAKNFKKKYKRLDVLVNNAGVYKKKRAASSDGIELTFAVNVLAYFLLTNELLEVLKKSAPSRIVNVASTYAGHLDLDDLEYRRRPYQGQKVYAQSKACDRLLTWAFARRLKESGVTANAMAPGFVRTALYREAGAFTRIMLRITGLIYARSPVDAARTAIWLAAGPEVEGVSGRFFEKQLEQPCEFKNHDDEEKLWKICEEMVQKSI